MTFGLAQLAVWWPLTVLVNLLARWGMPPEQTHPVALFLMSSGHSPWSWALVGYCTLVAAPFVEEMVFRGLLQTWLCRRVGAWGGIVGSGLLFALAHARIWPDPLPLAVLGIGLGIVYQRTRSLWAPVALHSSFNATMLMIGFFQEASEVVWTGSGS